MDRAGVDFLREIPGFGDAADRLIANNFDPYALKPYRGKDGRSYVSLMDPLTQKRKSVLVSNAPALLPRDAWVVFDQAVQRVIRDRLKAVADVRGAGLEYNIPNGMAHTVLQYQTLGDIGRATVSMDPARRSQADRPTTDIGNLPLPVVHKDFDFSAREIAVSRNIGSGGVALPIDTTTAEMAAIKVAEEVEMMLLGTGGTFTYGGGTIWGYTNLPQRATKTNMPIPDGTNGPAVLNAILALRQLLINARHFGPFVFYVNSQWAQVLDNDFTTTKGENTLRQRILAIEGIQDVRTLDFLPRVNWDCLMVEMNPLTVRMVVGMEVQTIQWETDGGMRKHFKVMCINTPQVRPDTAGAAGVGHGTTA